MSLPSKNPLDRPLSKLQLPNIVLESWLLQSLDILPIGNTSLDLSELMSKLLQIEFRLHGWVWPGVLFISAC
jgi:hypothetical protein